MSYEAILQDKFERQRTYELKVSLLFKAAKIARNDYSNLTLHIIRGDYLFCELSGGNPFFYGKTRFLSPTKKVDIEDLRKSDPCFF